MTDLGGNVVCESISRSILLDYLYFGVLGKKFLLPSFFLFRVYENEVLFSSFYSLYLDYEHEVIYTCPRFYIRLVFLA